jgi:Dual specificity phosphatase, catalytic domain
VGPPAFMDSSHPRSRWITREPSRQIRSKRGQRPSRERNYCIHDIRFGGHGSVTSCRHHAPVTGISFRVSHLRSTLHLLEWLDADPFWRVYLDVAWRGCSVDIALSRNDDVRFLYSNRVRWGNNGDGCVYKAGRAVTKIWERLYVGSLKDAVQLARSNPRRIATVISLCRQKAVPRSPKIIYIQIPIPDAAPISAQKLEDILYAIAIGVRRGSVLVHCREGMNRSPILVAAWMDRCGYAEIDKALSEIAKLRDLAPSRALLTSVRDSLRS